MVYMKAEKSLGTMTVTELRRRQAERNRAAVERIERFLREQDERLAAMGL